MWTLSCVLRVLRRAAAKAGRTTFGELFRATPLGIVIAALKGAPPPAGPDGSGPGRPDRLDRLSERG